MRLFADAIRDGNENAVRQAANERAEEVARRQFWEKANRFVALWGDFAAHLNEKQAFDAKLARKLSKAFHELETSDGWPVRGEPPTSMASSR